MNITIRKAVESDCNAIMDLVRELALFEQKPEAVTVNPEHFRDSGFGKTPVWWAFVAVCQDSEEKEKLVGISLYYIRYSTWKGQRLYLEDLIVNEKFRGRGIGRMLFEKTLQEAKDLGLGGASWQVLDWNEPAIVFYKQYGADITSGWLNGNLDF